MQGKLTTDCDGSARHRKWSESAGTLLWLLPRTCESFLEKGRGRVWVGLRTRTCARRKASVAAAMRARPSSPLSGDGMSSASTRAGNSPAGPETCAHGREHCHGRCPQKTRRTCCSVFLLRTEIISVLKPTCNVKTVIDVLQQNHWGVEYSLRIFGCQLFQLSANEL